MGLLESLFAKGSLEKAIDLQVSGQKAAKASQQTIERLDDESRQMLEEYRQLTQQLHQVTETNHDLQSKLKSQATEIDRISVELEDIEHVRSEIDPLMQKMLQTLDQLIKLDTPFLQEERQARLDTLETLFAQRSGEISERFRRLLEAYQIEVDYSRNIEAYQGQMLQQDGRQVMVDFLRLGRMALFYQTLDGQQGGVWNNQKRAWNSLESGHMAGLTKAIRIARKQLPPDLMVLPLIVPEESLQ
jgi:predicted RNase H-like nuclease (RuvC/YqgF family)